MARIEVVTVVNAPAERCFDLARSVDLHVRSAAGTGERVVAGPKTGLLGAGVQITWRARHFGVWQTLTSRISVFDRPRSFRDSLVEGAFAWLNHDHVFEPVGSGTRMTDLFEYGAPLGVLGRLAETLVLNAYLKGFLTKRATEIKRVAESDEWRLYVGPPGSSCLR